MITKRDRAIKFIQEGKKKFSTAQAPGDKEQGYNIYKTGVNLLFDCIKEEQNEEVVKVLKEKLKEFLVEIENMQKHLQSLKPPQENSMPVQRNSQAPPSNNQNNQNNQEESKNGDSNKKAEPKKVNDDNDKLKSNLMDAIVTEKPNVKWEDIAGLENAKKSLQEAVILPIRFPQIFVGSRKPWKGILLYGPPGTGKTYLAKACATEADGTFFSVSSSDLISKWVGESEKLIRTLFNLAREKKPSIIFIDEIDSMCGNRSDGENEATRRVKTEFLVQMQGVGKDDEGILVLGATNIPWGLDPAIRRRFEKRIYIPLPDYSGRRYLIKTLAAKTPNNLEEDDFDTLAEMSEGFSGADINILIRDASYQPLRKCDNATTFKKVNILGKLMYEPCPPSDPQAVPMTMMQLQGDQLKLPDLVLDDFLAALNKVRPSVSPDDIKKQIEFTTQFGQEG